MDLGLKVSLALVQLIPRAFVLAKRQTSARGDILESVRPLRGYLGGIANNLSIHIPAPLAGTQGIEKNQNLLARSMRRATWGDVSWL